MGSTDTSWFPALSLTRWQLGKSFHLFVPQFINLQNSYFLGEAFCNLHLEMQHKKVGLERSGGGKLYSYNREDKLVNKDKQRRGKGKCLISSLISALYYVACLRFLPLFFLRARKTTAPTWWFRTSTTQGIASLETLRTVEPSPSKKLTAGFYLGIWAIKVHIKLIPPLVKGEEEPLWLFVVSRSMPGRDMALL